MTYIVLNDSYMGDFLAYSPRNGFYHLDMVSISQTKCVPKRNAGGERERERERERFVNVQL